MDERLRQRAAIVALLRLPKVSWPEIAAAAIERGDAVELLAERLGEGLGQRGEVGLGRRRWCLWRQ
jgi:hypothetical protein